MKQKKDRSNLRIERRCLTLDGCEGRRKRFKESSEKYGWDIKFWPAFDGRGLKIEDYASWVHKGIRPDLNRKLMAGEVGLAISIKHLYKDALDTDLDYLYVFEDDVYFIGPDPGIPNRLFDICYLNNRTGGNEAYIISRDGIKKMLSMMDAKDKLDLPVDLVMMSQSKSNQQGISRVYRDNRPELICLRVDPVTVHDNHFPTTIQLEYLHKNNFRTREKLEILYRQAKKVYQKVKMKYRRLRVQKIATILFGPFYKEENRIEIDVTYKCNIVCPECDRSCAQAPSSECMSIGQIEKFIKESIEQKRNWRVISILGGEPTLHPQIFDILQLLLLYKKQHLPKLSIVLVTNGTGAKVQRILSRIPKGIGVVSGSSVVRPRNDHKPFNSAPVDSNRCKGIDFANGCWIPSDVGIGLTRYGYYPCAVGGGIDRIFGFNIGRKSMPKANEVMTSERRQLCRFCGHFLEKVFENKGKGISYSWEKAYGNYKMQPPDLSLYQ